MKQQTYDPSKQTEGDPSFDTESERAEAKALEHARAAEAEGADERAVANIGDDTAIGTEADATVGCDVTCKDTERAGRTPGETFSAGVWDAEMTSHGGQSGIAELERRASEQEVHPDDIEDEE